MKNKPILYVKNGCPWCVSAISYFGEQGLEVDLKDVSNSHVAMDRMVTISGQTKVPTFVYEDFVVADFSVEEFVEELNQRPDVKVELSLVSNADEF
jgi:glutaredoxin